MEINNSIPSASLLKAQQAWESRRLNGNVPKPVQSQPSDLASVSTEKEFSPTVAGAKRTGSPNPPTETHSNPKPKTTTASLQAAATTPQSWEGMIQDLQQVAKKAGFMGVSEQDIRQAYQNRQSLLADYRV